jgi:hypothetical protein
MQKTDQPKQNTRQTMPEKDGRKRIQAPAGKIRWALQAPLAGRDNARQTIPLRVLRF